MKKLFLKFSQYNRYAMIQFGEDFEEMEVFGLYIDEESKECKLIPVSVRYIFKHNALDIIYLALQPLLGVDVEIDSMPKISEMFMYARFSIKKQEFKEFPTVQESITYDDRYEEYYDKRWEEMAKIRMFVQNWEQLQQKWSQLKKELSPYIVLTLDDSGPFDKVEIIGKNELSQEDIQEIKIEHEKNLKYQRARRKYLRSHPDHSDVWRGPQDDEYEADMMKYLEE